jgi:hypothetical protein
MGLDNTYSSRCDFDILALHMYLLPGISHARKHDAANCYTSPALEFAMMPPLTRNLTSTKPLEVPKHPSPSRIISHPCPLISSSCSTHQSFLPTFERRYEPFAPMLARTVVWKSVRVQMNHISKSRAPLSQKVIYSVYKLREELDAKTHVDIFRQKFIRDLIFLQDVVVDARSCQCASEKESK